MDLSSPRAIFEYLFDPDDVHDRVPALEQFNSQMDYVRIYTGISQAMQAIVEQVCSADKYKLPTDELIRYDLDTLHEYAAGVEATLIKFAKRQGKTLIAGPPFATLIHQMELMEKQFTSGGDACASFASFADRALR